MVTNVSPPYFSPLFFTISSILELACTIGSSISSIKVDEGVSVIHRALYIGYKGQKEAPKDKIELRSYYILPCSSISIFE
jgi:hypothetical protein